MGKRRRYRRDALSGRALVAKGMRGLSPPPAVAALAEILERWDEAAGDLGAGSRPIGLSRAGVLTVACVSSAQAQRISDEVDGLIERLSDSRVTDLRAVVSSTPEGTVPDTVSGAAPTPPPTPRPRHRVAARQVARGVSDPALKQIVERGVAASLAKEDSPAKERKEGGADHPG